MQKVNLELDAEWQIDFVKSTSGTKRHEKSEAYVEHPSVRFNSIRQALTISTNF